MGTLSRYFVLWAFQGSSVCVCVCANNGLLAHDKDCRVLGKLRVFTVYIYVCVCFYYFSSCLICRYQLEDWSGSILTSLRPVSTTSHTTSDRPLLTEGLLIKVH